MGDDVIRILFRRSEGVGPEKSRGGGDKTVELVPRWGGSAGCSMGCEGEYNGQNDGGERTETCKSGGGVNEGGEGENGGSWGIWVESI